MDLSKIVSFSFRYPFRSIKKMLIICLFFILIAIIPIGMMIDNDYVIAIGVIAFFLFILFVPGYFLSIVRMGSAQSALLPSFNLVNNMYDSIRVIFLRMIYMIVPVTVFLIAFKVLSSSGRDLIFNYKIIEFFLTFNFTLLLIILIYLLFEFLLFFAKARLAYFNSFSEAVKINKVIGDIRRIGIFTIIKWAIVMLVLLVAASLVSSLIMAIPYVGFLIYVVIVIPILESIANYSLGLLYSNIASSYDDNLRNFKNIEYREYDQLK